MFFLVFLSNMYIFLFHVIDSKIKQNCRSKCKFHISQSNLPIFSLVIYFLIVEIPTYFHLLCGRFPECRLRHTKCHLKGCTKFSKPPSASFFECRFRFWPSPISFLRLEKSSKNPYCFKLSWST